MNHPNAQILEKVYAAFAAGDAATVLAACAENMTFQVAGKSQLAGKFTKANFESGFMGKLRELSGGAFKFEAHDIMASDRHGVVLGSEYVTRKGEQVQIRTVHVWRFENGKPVAWYEYPRDLYQFDAIWS